MLTLIKNAQIVNEGKIYKSDVLIENQKIKEIADEMGESPNGVRMILSSAGVYVKKSPAASSTKSEGNSSAGNGRVSKQGAQDSLRAAITDAGQEVDDDVLSKLTGKAAVYFTTVISAITP